MPSPMTDQAVRSGTCSAARARQSTAEPISTLS
jgi:hypothetical protein